MPAGIHEGRWEEGDDEMKKVEVGVDAMWADQVVCGKLGLVCGGTDPDEIVDEFARTGRICYTALYPGGDSSGAKWTSLTPHN